jgi:hypothetical protein
LQQVAGGLIADGFGTACWNGSLQELLEESVLEMDEQRWWQLAWKLLRMRLQKNGFWN